VLHIYQAATIGGHIEHQKQGKPKASNFIHGGSEQH